MECTTDWLLSSGLHFYYNCLYALVRTQQGEQICSKIHSWSKQINLYYKIQKNIILYTTGYWFLKGFTLVTNVINRCGFTLLYTKITLDLKIVTCHLCDNTIIQGVPGGMCQTSGECSLGQTIPI